MITPGEPPLTFSFGSPKVAVFVRLNASARNCSFIRSVMTKLRETERSRYLSPGPRSMLRPALPNAPGAGMLNALEPLNPLHFEFALE